MSETLVPIFFFLSLTAVAGTYLLTRHKERLSLIERGVSAENVRAIYSRPQGTVQPLSSLKWGLIFTLIGAGILIGMWVRAAYDVEEGIYAALVALCGGLGLIIFYFIARRHAARVE